MLFRIGLSLTLTHLLIATAVLAQPVLPTSSCDPVASKAVRDVLTQYLFDKTSRLDYTLPSTCQLRPELEKFWRLDQAEEHRGSTWRCKLCGWTFYSKARLQEHLYSPAHAANVSTDAPVCLADLCDVLHCQRLVALHQGGAGVKPRTSYQAHAPCRPAVQEDLWHRCKGLSAECFPDGTGQAATKLKNFFEGHFCGGHTCDAVKKKQLLKEIVQSARGANLPRYFVAGLIAALIACFYAGLWLWRKYELAGQYQSELISKRRPRQLSLADQALLGLGMRQQKPRKWLD